MASPAAIATALATFGEAYPAKAITEQTAQVWALAFEDVPDPDFSRAVMLTLREDRTFFPSVGEVRRNVVKAPAPPPPDSDAILRQIDGMGSYNPHAGWVRPSVERIRDRFGDDLADAYAAEGPHRLYADNDTTRDIARAAFSKAITAAHHEAVRLGLPPAHKALTVGGPVHPDVRVVIANVARGMGA